MNRANERVIILANGLFCQWPTGNGAGEVKRKEKGRPSLKNRGSPFP
jgi:hypothetical protein